MADGEPSNTRDSKSPMMPLATVSLFSLGEKKNDLPSLRRRKKPLRCMMLSIVMTEL